MAPRTSSPLTSPVEAFSSFRWSRGIQPGQVRLADFDYLKPDFAIDYQEPVPGGDAVQVSSFGDNLVSPDDARRLARVRAQELRAREVEYRAQGNVYGLHLGTPGPEGHNLELATKGSALIDVGSQDIYVAHDKTEVIGGDVDEKNCNAVKRLIGSDYTTEVKGKRRETVDGHVQALYKNGFRQEVSAAGVERYVKGGETEAIEGSVSQRISGDLDRIIDGSLTDHFTGESSIHCDSDLSIQAKGLLELRGHKVETHSDEWLEINGLKKEIFLGNKFEAHVGLKGEASLAGRFGLHATNFELGGICGDKWAKHLGEKEIKIDIILSDIAFVSIKIVQ